MLVITEPTLDSLFNSIVALSEMGVKDEARIEISPLANVTGGFVLVATDPAPNRGVKQRCATKDGQGRRCIRGARHREQHRYENVDGDE
jgi:hypothetical protein